MKYLALVTLFVLTACTIQPVRDLRAPEVAAATQTARAEAIPPITIEPSLLPTVTPTPCDAVIKGNIRNGRKLYHLPGMRNYNQVIAEEMFCTEQDAMDAGYTKAGN